MNMEIKEIETNQESEIMDRLDNTIEEINSTLKWMSICIAVISTATIVTLMVMLIK